MIGGSLPAALAADWLTSTWDMNTTLYVSGPAAAVVEEVAGAWLKEILRLPETASFAFVTGCQMAHVTCVAAARHGLLGRLGWDVEEQGLAGAPSIRILSGQRHGSTERAVRLLGLGQRQIVELPTDDEGRMLPYALERELSGHPSSPAIVLLQAGDINTGMYDLFDSVIPVAHRHGAWVHIDGAFGLWAAASLRFQQLLAGAANADSWATDGHKWLNVPFDCGYAFVADAGAHRADARDQRDWTPEWSRRARGFPTYAALRQLGRCGVGALIERCCDHARTLVDRIGALPGVEVVSQPVINQGPVRFLDAVDSDRRTEEVISAIAATGEAFFSGTTWRGRRAMRISVINWQTSEADVDRAVRACADVLGV